MRTRNRGFVREWKEIWRGVRRKGEGQIHKTGGASVSIAAGGVVVVD
jgi:hypothetical protein